VKEQDVNTQKFTLLSAGVGAHVTNVSYIRILIGVIIVLAVAFDTFAKSRRRKA